MLRIMYLSHEGELREHLTVHELPGCLRDQQGLLWLDISEEPHASIEMLFTDVFDFHPLAIDDALQETHTPKVDDWNRYLYLVLHAVRFDQEDGGGMSTLELDLFLGSNFLVTYQEYAIQTIDRIWSLCLRDERYLKRGSGYLLYRVADELVTDFMPAVEEIDDAIDQIEDEIFDRPNPRTLEQIFSLKRSLLRLRRIVAPQREVLNKLARGDFAVIAFDDQVYFRDVYDHLVRLHDITESLRDLVSSALDTYLSVINNRMNEVMKILTLITTLFMPVSFLVGFFGMNFFQPVLPLEVWTGQPVFFVTLSVMLLLPLGMYLWMRRRAWM